MVIISLIRNIHLLSKAGYIAVKMENKKEINTLNVSTITAFTLYTSLVFILQKTILRKFDNRDNAIRRQKPNLSRQGERIRHILYSLCVATLHIMPATNPSMNITHRIRFV